MGTDPVLRCEIRGAKNGWILKVEHPAAGVNEPDEIVVEEKYDSEIECFADFLRTLDEELGPSTSRYSPQRIYIQVRPGDKHEDTIDSVDG